jgi:hypothetical protein
LDSIINGTTKGFKSGKVDQEFHGRCKSKIPEVEGEILRHRQRLMRSSLNGSLDFLDIETIIDKHIDTSWEIAPALESWYRKEVEDGTTMTELETRVANFARTISQRISQGEALLDTYLETITRVKSYASIESRLTKIPSDDRWICLDAHHAALSNNGSIELATTNPAHLKDGGREALIKRETAIDRVRNLCR